MTTPCPEPRRLALWCEGTLPEAEQTAIAAHVEHCAACQLRLDQADRVERDARDGQAASGEAAVGGPGGASAGTWRDAAERLKLAAGRFSSPAPPLAAAIRSLKSQGTADVGGATGVSPDLPAGFLAPPEAPGQLGRLGDYDVLEEIGRGTMGIVLRAFDRKLQRVVAIKVMSPQLASFPLARQRFIREGHTAAAVCHEHVVTIHAVDESAGLPYLVMQYVAGKTLQKRLDQSGPLRTVEILRIGMQTAYGLAAAHAQGLIHRDIKPENLLLENGVERVKITDFGLARAVDDASLTQTGVIAGTPQYMAPEQARGETLDARADLFSLGCVLYALCTGVSPFRASGTLAVLKRICEDTPSPIRNKNPEIPDWLAAVVMKLLAKDAAARFPSALALAELLEQCLAHVQQPNNHSLPTTVNSLLPELRSVAAMQVAAMPAAAPSVPAGVEQRRRDWLLKTRGGNGVLSLLIVAPILLIILVNKAIDRWLPPVATGSVEVSRQANPVSERPTDPEAIVELERLTEIGQRSFAIVEANYKAGAVPKSERNEAEISWREVQSQLARAKGDAATARSSLSRVVELRLEQLEMIKQLVAARAASQVEVLSAERRLAEARIALAQER